jgi:hypothetical protein
MNWSDVMDIEDLREDVYMNGWCSEYKDRLSEICPDYDLKITDPDERYQSVLDEVTQMEMLRHSEHHQLF